MYDPLLSRFHQLSLLPRPRPSIVVEEMWRLAQAICARENPHLQKEVDQVRSKVFNILRKQPAKHFHKYYMKGNPPVLPTVRVRFEWTDIQLTPEFHNVNDKKVLGKCAPRAIFAELKEKLRLQKQVVVNATLGVHA